jgi:arabinosyltransferase A
MGVATANSILVISFARERLALHGDAVLAAVEAGFARFRPVCMTALAMIIGMSPLALGMGEGGEQNAPLGRAVIGGLIFATNPADGIDAARNGLFVRANADSVFVAFRDQVAAVAPRAKVAAGACSAIRAWANPGAAGADFVGIPGATGTLPPDKKPQVTGIFTDLKVPVQQGLSARIDIDTRFITRPTALKLAVMVSGVACVIASIVALAILDRRRRMVPPPGSRHHLLRHWPADMGVIGTLLLWHVIGAISSDDGYNLTIARISGEAGYATNYYRYFGTSEAPFDWYQSVLAQLASVSTSGVWMRLPATAAAIGSWLILSHRVLPKFRRSLALF